MSPIPIDPQQAQANVKQWIDHSADEAEDLVARENMQDNQEEEGESSLGKQEATVRPSRVRAKPKWLKDFVGLLES